VSNSEKAPNVRRRVGDALRENEARLRAVIDGVADVIITINEAGVIQDVNKSTEATFGYSSEELLGENVSKLMPIPHHSQHDGDIGNYLGTGMTKIIGMGREVEGARKDGSKFPAELRVTKIHRRGERLFIGFIRDLTEKRMLEARLRRLHGDRLSSMAEMAVALAHELNQPLSAAANYLEAAQRLLQAGPQRPPEVGEALDHAASQMLRAGRIVSRLHEFISRGDPETTTHSLHAIIRQACELAGPLLKENKVALVLRLDADKDSILADKVQLQQALVALMRNACEAMSASKVRKLTLATSVTDETLRVDVIDTGVGLSKSIDADFFEPFATSKPNGLGVGLSISRSIVEAHQGRIWADPDADGGARFSFTLPLAESETAQD
jgi:two-component system, chemotaxis family, CheB/CheR fusion protein